MKIKTNWILLLTGIGILWIFANIALAKSQDAVVVDIDADTPVVQLEKNRKAIIRVLVRPDTEKASQKRRLPLAVALVLDKSGSMASDVKMENAKLGALQALNMLGQDDIATVVVYDTEARVLGNPQKVHSLETLTRAIRRIQPSGSTALYDGITVAAKQLSPLVNEGYIPRIVLLSDGMANVGPSSTQELASLGRSLALNEMTITTIGLGLDYNEDLMTALAAESGGNSYFAQNADRLPEIFTHDMQDAVTLTARKIRVIVNCGEGVRPLKIIGRKGQVQGSTLETSIDNLYGAEKYALFEVELPQNQKDETFEAASITLKYHDASTDTEVVHTATLNLRTTGNEEDVIKNRRNDIASQAALARNAEIREEIIRLTDSGKSVEAAQILKQREQYLKGLAPSAGQQAPQLEAEAQALGELAEVLETQKSMPSPARKKVLNDAYQQRNQQSSIDSNKSSQDSH